MQDPRLRVVLAAAAIVLAGCGSDAPPPAGTAASAEPTTVEFVAYDMGYEPMEATVPAGAIEIVLVNEGAAVHNVIIEELDDLIVAEARAGERATGDVTLRAGTYTLYCDVPGHRSAGMDRTLTVE